MKVLGSILAIFTAGLTSACDQSQPSAQTSDAVQTGDRHPGAPPPAPSKPALWKTGDADTTVYLFGTVHVLPAELQWRTPAIDQAFSESGAIFFETDIEPDQVEMSALVTRLGLYSGEERLSQQLNDLQKTALNAAAEEMQISLNALDRMRPWLAATTLSQRMIVRAGYDPNSGVEKTLAPMAVQGGKTIRKFETLEDQLMVFAGLPEATQLRYLLEGLEEIDSEAKILHDLVEAWRVGDVEGLDRIMIENELSDQSEVYDALLVRRNRNWTVQLDRLIESETGVFFVAVGAAHLAGKDSVVEMLATEGHAATRVQ